MKYEVFANELEANVGRSPVRGGEAIKTHRKSTNIISRVKSLFPREPQTTTPAIAESATGTHVSKAHKSVASSELTDTRCRALFTDLCVYLTKELHISDESISLHGYSNGAAVISTAPNFILGLVLINTSEGQKNLPDNTALVMHHGSDLDEENFVSVFNKFRLHLLRLCRELRVQHLAYDFAPPRPGLPTTVTADCLCHRLYEDYPTTLNYATPTALRRRGGVFLRRFPKKTFME